MAIEALGELASGAIRLVVQLTVEVVFELVIRGTGYSICKYIFRQQNINSNFAAAVGLIFWLILGLGTYIIWTVSSVT